MHRNDDRLLARGELIQWHDVSAPLAPGRLNPLHGARMESEWWSEA